MAIALQIEFPDFAEEVVSERADGFLADQLEAVGPVDVTRCFEDVHCPEGDRVISGVAGEGEAGVEEEEAQFGDAFELVA